MAEASQGQQPGQAQRAVHEELAELQVRFRLLEGDRKSFYESSQNELRENKAQQDWLRNENKVLKAQLTKLQKEHAGRDGGPGSELHAHELQKLEHQHNVLRQKHNSVSCANREKELEAQTLNDQLRDLQRHAKRPAAQESPLTRQIRILENRLDKAMIKYNEAQSIKRTYEQIVKRLKEERINFDHQLSAIEETLRAKSSDYDELLLMSNEASHARDVARQELGKAEAIAADEKKHRETELRARRALVDAQKEVMARMGTRDSRRKDIILEAKGDLDAENEERLREEYVAKNVSRVVAEGAIADETERASQYEAAFRKIKEATGVADVNEVIKKFLTQEATLESLKTQIADAQARLDTLTDERAAAKRELDELKYAGVTGAGGRQEVDVVERKLAEANGAVEKAKTRYERLAKALVDLRAGVEHLNAKLETASRGREEEEEEAAAAPAAAAEAGAGAPAGAEGAGAPAASDDAVLAVLGACQSKLLRLMRDVEAPADGAAAPAAAAPFARGAVRADSAPDDAATRAAGSAFLEELLDENNVRVSFSKLDTQDDDDDDDDEDDDDADAHDVPDRETMKKLHGVLLEKASSKGKRRRKLVGGTPPGGGVGLSPAAGAANSRQARVPTTVHE